MRIGPFYFLILTLSSCTDTPVEITSTPLSSFLTLEILSSSNISKNQSVTFSMTTAYRDAAVSRVSIYSDSFCMSDSTKVSEISNLLGATSTSTVLTEGTHNFFYKPVYSTVATNLTALCLPAGISYTVDRTAPAALVISRTTLSPTVDRNVGLAITGCENNDVGASNLLFTESSSPPPSLGDPRWEDCSGNKTFTVSAPLTTKNIYAFAKDLAGNISNVSNSTSMTLNAAPNITTAAIASTFYFDVQIAPIIFTNSGGPITNCTTDTSLPSGLSINASTCAITGIPTATQGPKNYLVKASGSGVESAFSISIEVKPLPAATITFDPTGAGPGTGGSGGQTYHTLLNATIGGTDVVAYKYFLDKAADISCGTYIGEVAISERIVTDLASFEGAKRLCVKGRNSAGIWQQVPTIVSWRQEPKLQNLSDDFPTNRAITMDNQPANTQAATRSFLVGSAGTDISCSGCLVSSNGGSFTNALTGLVPSDKVNFLMNTSGDGTTATASFVFASISYSLSAKAAPATTCSGNPIFLTRNTISGNMGGTVGADNFCNQEAANAGFATTTGWKALLSSSTSIGLNLLGSLSNYCDSKKNHLIISARGFQNPFLHFVDGTPVNGGSYSEWKFIASAPRNITSTQFWYGNATECNCNNWTTESASATCSLASGNANGGHLTFESSSPKPMTSLPDTGVIGACTSRQHLVCVQP